MLENEGELYSLSELFDKMKELAKPSTNVYGTKKLFKRKHSIKMRTNYFFADMDGKSNVLCFRNMANSIVNLEMKTQKIQDVLL